MERQDSELDRECPYVCTYRRWDYSRRVRHSEPDRL